MSDKSFSKESSIGSVFSLIIIIAGLAIGFVMVINNLGRFSPDSYSYYDISKTFFTDFGRVTTIRQYVVKSDYNCSFPYLYPLILFFIDKLTHLGMYSGVLFNSLLMPVIAAVFAYISKRFTKSYLSGAIVSFILFINYDFLEEVFTARSIPFSVLLFAISAYLICNLYLSQDFSVKKLIMLGLVAGLNMVNRFDEAIFALYLIPAVFVSMKKGKRFTAVLIYGVSTALPVFPWVLYSLKYFQKPFASDNGGTLFLVNSLFPNRVELPDEHVKTITTDFFLWVEAVFKSLAESVKILITDYCLVYLLLIVAIVYITNVKKVSIKSLVKKNTRVTTLVGFVFLYSLLKFMMYVLVKYGTSRYFIIISLTCVFAILIILDNADRKDNKNRLFYFVAVAIIVAMIPYQTIVLPREKIIWPSIDELTWINNTENILRAINSEDAVLIVDYNTNCFSYGVLTGRKTYVLPINPSIETIDYVVCQHDDIQWMIVNTNVPTYLYDDYLDRYDSIECDEYLILKVR